VTLTIASSFSRRTARGGISGNRDEVSQEMFNRSLTLTFNHGR
jgi:hypothetical protein